VQEALNEFGDRFELAEPNIKWKTRGVGDYDFASKCLRANPEKTLTNGFFLAIFQAK
jgi:16S rRNA C967 or C1407 C5-methylase (RsmB/RsmF family)